MMSSWTLEVEPFPGMRTGVAITRGLEARMDRWKLRPDACTMLPHDGTSNAVLGSDILAVRNMPCIPHWLHLVLGHVLDRLKEDSTLVVVEGSEHNQEYLVVSSSLFVLSGAHDDGEVAQASELDQETSIAELEKFIASSSTWHKDALAQVRGIVQRFRALAGYFHKSAKATNSLDEIQTAPVQRK
ncbi:hypothetical protein PHMEG_0008401 [Phytophthora megakarya]|uniref:Uncharacterized protein n=1 Tax=Phytophthora megakarya TaxID=4795 RepID=A0A225WJP4_9STRA|nr:hypothetical protein PHMEG_0008401 [Phytophthora megakarya]